MRNIYAVTLAAWALAALSFAAGPARAGKDPDPREILQRMAKEYASLDRCDILEEWKSPPVSPTAPDSLSLTFRYCQDGPGRSRADGTTTGLPGGTVLHILSISNGDSSWNCFSAPPLLNQYTVQAAAVVKTGAGEGSSFGGPSDLLVHYRSLADHLSSPTLAGREDVAYMGKKVECFRVEARQKIIGPTAPLDSVPTTLWIDRKNYLVLKEVDASSHFRLTARMLSGSFSKKLPDSLFVFRPPAGAQRVKQIGVPGAAPAAALTGTDAPDFTLRDMDGTSVHLKDLQGKVVLLDFWATWCGPCRMELPVVRKMRGEFGADKLAVYGVDMMEPRAKVADFLQANPPFGYPVLRDSSGMVASQYRVNAIPVLAVINRQGKVSWSHLGLASEDSVRAALHAAVDGK